MLKWFRRAAPPYQTALAMIGPRAGDRVLFVGDVDAGLAAEVARVTGLNGHTVVAAPAAAGPRLEAAAAEAGALLVVHDTAADPVPRDQTFDIAVYVIDVPRGIDADRALARDAHDRLAPGGRVIIRTRAKRGRPAGDGSAAGAGAAPGAPLDLLQRAGAIATRHLATAEGSSYFEGRRARS